MTQIHVILKAIEKAKAANKTLNNKDIISIFKATKSIAEDQTLLNSLIHLYATLDTNKIAQVKTLSKRETQVLSLIGDGLLTEDIAKDLGLSPSTIETHRKNMRRKLKLTNKNKLFEYALIYNVSRWNSIANDDKI